MHKRFAAVAVLAVAGLLAGGTSNTSTAAPEASQSLGTIAALGKQIKVTADGTVTAGQPATIAVKTGQKVDDVSGWLGNQADIANKVTCQLQTDEPKPDYDCMITIPSTVPAGAMIWIQVTSNGNPESGSVRVPKTS